VSRLLILILGALGATLVLLLVNNERGSTFGIANDAFARIAMLGVLAAVLAAGVMRRGMKFQDTARQAAVWLVLLIALVASYQYRFELQNIASRVTAGLIPSRPQTAFGADGALRVTIGKASNGHFEADGAVNGAGVSFLVDTGASSVVLTMEAAKAAGIQPDGLAFTFPVSTANGIAFAAKVTLGEVKIGDIERRNVSALVAEQGKLDQSLLGMSFLSSLSAYAVQQDQMILQD
jgi:aspartyl protease family protein